MHKQVSWQAFTSDLTDEGRRGILKQYRQLRTATIKRSQARDLCWWTVQGVWMAKQRGW